MPVVGAFKHALVSDGTGLNVDNSDPRGCPLWVKSGHLRCKKAVQLGMSALGQKRTCAVRYDVTRSRRQLVPGLTTEETDQILTSTEFSVPKQGISEKSC
jgi:hypothetical protein